MDNKPNLDEILRRNPQIDRSDVDTMIDALTHTRTRRTPMPQVDLTEPLGGRRVKIREDVAIDSKVVRLRHLLDSM